MVIKQTSQGCFGSDSKTVTMAVGGQEDKEEGTVKAALAGQIPAAQQLQEHVWVRERLRDFNVIETKDKE